MFIQKKRKGKERKEQEKKRTREQGEQKKITRSVCHDRPINVGTITGAAYLLLRRFWNRGDPVVGILGRSARR